MTTKRAALYLRVSTGEQSTEMQRTELEAIAARAGWQVVDVVCVLLGGRLGPQRRAHLGPGKAIRGLYHPDTKIVRVEVPGAHSIG